MVVQRLRKLCFRPLSHLAEDLSSGFLERGRLLRVDQ